MRLPLEGIPELPLQSVDAERAAGGQRAVVGIGDEVDFRFPVSPVRVAELRRGGEVFRHAHLLQNRGDQGEIAVLFSAHRLPGRVIVARLRTFLPDDTSLSEPMLGDGDSVALSPHLVGELLHIAVAGREAGESGGLPWPRPDDGGSRLDEVPHFS